MRIAQHLTILSLEPSVSETSVTHVLCTRKMCACVRKSKCGVYIDTTRLVVACIHDDVHD